MSKKIGIVGATGLVGTELLSLFEEREVSFQELRLFASDKSCGKIVHCDEQEYEVERLVKDRLLGLDYIFFCSSKEVSHEYIPFAADHGACCIDNSASFRQDPKVPLVVPEINKEDARKHKGIIANPNCSTIIALMALFPLHKLFAMTGFCVSTYQAVSGVGYKGIKSLIDYSNKENITSASVFGEQILHNAIPKIGDFFEDGYSSEEIKMLNESRKILSLQNLKVSATCVRVPVVRAHSMSIIAQFRKKVDLDMAKEGLTSADGVDFFDRGTFPTPLKQAGRNNISVGRLRVNTFLENALEMWVVGDQIRKGAALNALQIFELLEK